MSINRSIAVILPSLLILFCGFSPPSKKANPEAGKILEQSKTLIQEILDGKNDKEVQSSIDPAAYIVEGNTFQSLLGEMRDPGKSSLFSSARPVKIEYLSGEMSDDCTSAFFVVQTKAPDGSSSRFHSVFLMKSDSSGLMIKHWHTSR